MADQATTALRPMLHVQVDMVAGTVGESGNCYQTTIKVGRDGTNVRWLLAHELDHQISGSCGSGLFSEKWANATAIKVLQVWGDTEKSAVFETEQHLLMLERTRKGNPLHGHDYCAEYWDIRERYPQFPPSHLTWDAATCPEPRR